VNAEIAPEEMENRSGGIHDANLSHSRAEIAASIQPTLSSLAQERGFT
jgi:hypothetical protein